MIINVFSLRQANDVLENNMHISNWISIRDYRI